MVHHDGLHSMTPDEQEALSRKYSDDVIILLPLKSGHVAVFNSARELCGIDDGYGFCEWDDTGYGLVFRAPDCFRQPIKPPSDFTLEDLGL